MSHYQACLGQSSPLLVPSRAPHQVPCRPKTGDHRSRAILFFGSLGVLVVALGVCFLFGEVSESDPGNRGTTARAEPARRRGKGESAKSSSRSSAGQTASSEGSGPVGGPDGSDIYVRLDFNSSPAKIRRAINAFVASRYPQAVPYLTWDSTGTQLSASKMGASCSIVLSGKGPTVVDVNGDIGFPASLFVSTELVRKGLDQAIRDIKKKTS